MNLLAKYGLVEGFQKNSKKQILDPLTTILRLAVLKFKPHGTKIGIRNNAIWMQSPTLMQGPLRWSRGDGRDDLHNLYAPICAATRWYSTKDSKPIKRIFLAAIDGLLLIKEIYSTIDESNLVSHSISHYITLLENALTASDNLTEIPPTWNKIWKDDEIIVVDSLLQISERYPETMHYIKAVENILTAKDKQTKRCLHMLLQPTHHDEFKK